MKIIINADDFGASKSVNEGIKRAILARRVNSVSVLVTAPYFDDAVQFLKRHRNISVGLHFDLAGDSRVGLVRVILAYMIGMRSLKSVTLELSRQYAKLHKTGLKISHIDSHQHSHLFPPFFAMMFKFATKHQIQRIRCARFTISQWLICLDAIPSLKQMLIWLLSGVNYYLFIKNEDQRIAKIDLIYDLNWHDDYAIKTVSTLFRNIPQGTTEVVCHLSSKLTPAPLSSNCFRCLSLLLKDDFRVIMNKYHVV